MVEQNYNYRIISNRNKRDNIYNLSIQSLNAKDFIEKMYNNTNLYLDRKHNKAQEVLQ